MTLSPADTDSTHAKLIRQLATQLQEAIDAAEAEGLVVTLRWDRVGTLNQRLELLRIGVQIARPL